MFRASSCPSSGTTTTAVAASGLPSEVGGSGAVGRGRAGRPDHDQQHCYHQVPMVNQRLLLQLLWLLMMGMRMPETCWVVFKWQLINMRSCCIWLVDSVESMMMHGLKILVIIPCGSFGKTCQSHLQASRIPNSTWIFYPWRWDR